MSPRELGLAHAKRVNAQAVWRGDGAACPDTPAGRHWFRENDAFLKRFLLEAVLEKRRAKGLPLDHPPAAPGDEP